MVTTRLPRTQRREQLIRCAAAVFVRGGFGATSMDDVAREAGVTRLIVYRIFESKEELYRAVLDSVLDDLVAEFDAHDPADARDAEGPTADRHTVVGWLFAVARRHPDGFRLLWRHAAHEAPFRDTAALFRVGVTEYALELLRDVLSDPVMRLWAAESLVANLHESICLWLDDGDPSRDDECRAMLVEGVRATVERWAARARPG